MKDKQEAGVLPLASFLNPVLYMWSETRSRLFEFLAHGWVSIRKIYLKLFSFVPFVVLGNWWLIAWSPHGYVSNIYLFRSACAAKYLHIIIHYNYIIK